MDNDDEFSCSSSPNHFLISTYKENVPMNERRINENNFKSLYSYQCCLCRKIFDNPILTCTNCVNTGQFCSSKHETCSNKRREILSNMLNQNDYEEYQIYLTDKSIHFQFCDRMFLVKKFHSEKKLLQSEFQTTIKSSIETRQMMEEIQLRKNRFHRFHHSIKRLQEQIEQKKQLNNDTQQRINQTHLRIERIKVKLDIIDKTLHSSRDKNQTKLHLLDKQEEKLDSIRRERFNELCECMFPIQRVSAIEEALAIRMKDLSDAQQTITDEINDDQVENDKGLVIADYRYQIVNSCLPTNGNYQIENFPLTTNTDDSTPDPDSPQSSLSRDYYEVLSALSHACQLVNVIAFYLHINLPFRLHQLEFNTDILTIDCLRANIAKLNANILNICLSQGIPIDSKNVKYTLENLFKLITLPKYLCRPEPVLNSEEYIDIIEKDVNEISRAFITDYWFDDEDNEKDVTDILNNDEWEAIPQVDYIPDDPFIDEHSALLSSSSSPQHSSIMSGSIGYLKTLFGFN